MNTDLEVLLWKRYGDFIGPLRAKRVYERSFFACDDGWFLLIDQFCQDIVALAAASELRPVAEQVKEKFGGLRIHASPAGDPRIRALVDAVREKSLSTCEECGQPGALRGITWFKTLCDPHATAWEAARAESTLQRG